MMSSDLKALTETMRDFGGALRHVQDAVATMRDALVAQQEDIQQLNEAVAADITALSFAASITLRSDDALIPAVREFGRRRVADASPAMQEKIRAAYLELLGIEM